MFINKWLITDSFDSKQNPNRQIGLCLSLRAIPHEVSNLHQYLQKLPENSFSLLLSEKDISPEKINASYIETIIGIFFQPCYYLYNYQPVFFLMNGNSISLNFCNTLQEKCKKQGLQISIVEVKNNLIDDTTNQFAYQLTTADINYNLILKKWLSLYVENKNPGEIHLLVSEKQPGQIQILNKINRSAFKEIEEYKTAHLFYEKQKLIDEYKHELDLKMLSEKDTQLYLKIQKEQVQNNVEWYHHEYEILPGWYKRLGHIIKVLMGKRTFRSLFNDEVKKYKD